MSQRSQRCARRQCLKVKQVRPLPRRPTLQLCVGPRPVVGWHAQKKGPETGPFVSLGEDERDTLISPYWCP